MGSQRRTGIEALDEVAWGTHLCLLYEAEADLFEVLVPYVQAGLEQDEFCLWITSSGAQRQAVQSMLRTRIPGLERLITEGRLALVNQNDWYYGADGKLDLAASSVECGRRLKAGLTRGLTGMRMASSAHWRSRAEWDALVAFERGVNKSITEAPMLSVCCYPLGRCGPAEIAEVVSTHQHALLRRSGQWAVVENAEYQANRKQVLESERNYRRMFETAANLITSVDGEGIIVDCNQRILDVLGYEKGEIIGRHMSTIMHPDYHDKASRSLAKILEKGFLLNHEYKMVRKDGGIIDVVINSSALGGEEGAYDRSLCIISDVTETKRLREVSRQAEKMQAVGTLAGGIAHDFNNLLGVILGNVSYAVQSLNPTKELKDLLADVQAGATRAQGLTQQLLTFAEGGDPLQEPTALAPLVEEAANFAASGSNVRCDVAPEPGLPLALVDPGQVSQVVHNLVINASQAMPDGGRIHITLEASSVMEGMVESLAPGRYVKLRFMDQGPGIQAEDRDRIFEPYFTTRQGRQGLGLATVFSVAKRHGGAVALESSSGEGSTFAVYLPAAEISTAAQPEAKEMGPTRRVLVMDDQQAVQRMVCRILDRMGLEHEVSADGAAAVALYKAALKRGKPFDLVILDLTVPAGLGGRETVKLLKDLDPEVQAVVSSGYANDPVMAQYKEHGFAGVLAKPYTYMQFKGLIQELLGAA